MAWMATAFRLPIAVFCCFQVLAHGDDQPPMRSDFACPPTQFQANAAAVPIDGHKNRFMPVLTSMPPGTGKRVDLAIIVVHGGRREVQQYFYDMLEVVELNEEQEHTLVVAPGMGDVPCAASQWLQGSSRRRFNAQAPVFTKGVRQWMFGQKSDGSDASGFEGLDAVISWVETKYVSVQKVLVMAFSSGGQMVQRWIMMTPHGLNGRTIGGTPMRIIIGSPSSVAYIDRSRPVRACSPDKDTGPGHLCGDFREPHRGNQVCAVTCNAKWDNYPFGTSALKKDTQPNGTIRSDVGEYLHSWMTFEDEDEIPRILRERMATKDLRYLFGSLDTKSCFEGRCSDECKAMVQGANRLQRGMNYISHLKEVYPGSVQPYGIFHAGHDHYGAFLSKEFSVWAFAPSYGRDDADEGTEDNSGFFKHRRRRWAPFLRQRAMDLAKARSATSAKARAAEFKVKGGEPWFPGPSLGSHPNRTAAQCERICDSTPLCHSFVHADGGCDLKGRCVVDSEPMSTLRAEAKTYYRSCHMFSDTLPGDDVAENVDEKADSVALRRVRAPRAALLGGPGLIALVAGAGLAALAAAGAAAARLCRSPQGRASDRQCLMQLEEAIE